MIGSIRARTLERAVLLLGGLGAGWLIFGDKPAWFVEYGGAIIVAVYASGIAVAIWLDGLHRDQERAGR